MSQGSLGEETTWSVFITRPVDDPQYLLGGPLVGQRVLVAGNHVARDLPFCAQHRRDDYAFIFQTGAAQFVAQIRDVLREFGDGDVVRLHLHPSSFVEQRTDDCILR